MTKDFAFCLVIPVFRHAHILNQFLPHITRHGIPVFVIDDGNNEPDQLLLKKMEKLPKVEVLRLESNLGKGAAVMAGLNHGQVRGFTHAVQVDADGQHNYEEIPRFIEAARSSPAAMVLGVPKFDSSAPWIRVWGRKLSNFFVALDSWSFSVQDSLFGFRVYPIQSTLMLHERQEFHPRMGFEVDTVVRHLWEGRPVVNIVTKVRYPVDGVSNFRYFRDNVALVGLHTRRLIQGLIFGPLGLIARMRRKEQLQTHFAHIATPVNDSSENDESDPSTAVDGERGLS